MSNVYWSGGSQASLSQSQVSASWGRPGISHSLTAIQLANRAFEVYFTAHQNIMRCPTAQQQTQMLGKLHDAARQGWGSGVSDLEESFEHLVSTGGRWTDDNTENYYGGPNKIFQRALVTGPEGPVNFLDAVDDNVAELRRVFEQYNTQVQQLQQAQSADNWTRVGEVLGNVKTWGERAQPFLWWAPAHEQGLGRMVSFADVLGNIHAGATTFVNAQAAGFDQRTSAAIGAMRTAIGFVPVLGEFYGKAVDMIPGLATWFRGLIRERVRRLDAAAAGRPY